MPQSVPLTQDVQDHDAAHVHYECIAAVTECLRLLAIAIDTIKYI